MSNEIVNFSFFFEGTVYAASALSKDSVERLYRDLRKDDDHKHVFSDFPISKCKFYRLKSPVDLLGDENASLEFSNLENINPNNTRISSLAGASKNFESHLVYLVIEPIKDTSTDAVDSLRNKYPDHVSSLTIEVTAFLKWTEADVTKNLRGGQLLQYDHEEVPNDIRRIQQRLARPRTYQGVANDPEFVIAQQVGSDLFDSIFSAVVSPDDCRVRDVMEFLAFHNILRCFHALVGIIRAASPSCKAGNFTVYFIQPPFFSDAHSENFLFTTEKPWKFPIFLHLSNADAWRKFTPRNDFMLYAPKHSAPLLVSEVISQMDEEDRYRLLHEAIAAARIGNHLTEAGAEAKFFVVVLYLDAKMIASRYIVMQTGGDEESNDAVSISRRDFDLGNRRDAVEFVREMYNLVDEVSELSHNLSQSQKSILSDIKKNAKDIISLHSKSFPAKKAAGIPLSTVEERDERGGRTAQRSGPADVWGDFYQNANDINAKLQEMGYCFQCVIEGHPNVAAIGHKVATDRRGFLKFIKTDNEREVSILRYLSKIESSSNYTISNVDFWPVAGGTVVSMPLAGRWLIMHPHLEANLWSIASQLVEAVEFMHKHGVAHMDIKPHNVLILDEGGRLSIIDFSSAIRVENANEKYTGVVGTETYMAPEVEKGSYLPLKADLYSCGRTLEELCSRCRTSPDQVFLLDVATRLMNEDPQQRPTMEAVRGLMSGKPVRRLNDVNIGTNSFEFLPTTVLGA